jgi:hypothetical protein
MTAHARWESPGQEKASVVSQERVSGYLQAGAACALVFGHAGAHRVGAVTTDEPPILVGDHRPEVDTRYAMGAADGQDCVSRHWGVPPALSKGRRHVGFQNADPAIRLKAKDRGESCGALSTNLRRDSVVRADRRADQARVPICDFNISTNLPIAETYRAKRL